MLLKIVVPKKLTESLKNNGEIAPFLVKLQTRGHNITVPTITSSLALRAKER